MRSAIALPIVGLILLLLGLVPVFGRPTQVDPPATSAPEPAGRLQTTVGTGPIAEAPVIDGISPAISRVLHARGFLGSVDVRVLGEELPTSVVAVLIEHRAVLPVAVGP